MKKTFLIISTLCLACFVHAQDIFRQHGFDREVLTLSKGRYDEVFTNSEVVQIGTVLLNTRTNKIIKFLDEETEEIPFKAEHSSRWLSVDPLAEKYPQISSYVYCANNPIKYIDPDGREIRLAGNAAERQTTLTHLQMLTNDKLGMRSDGTVIISRMGGENSGQYLRAGSELIRDLNKKGDGAKTVTISIGSVGSGNSATTVDRNATGGVDWTNATNGTGANATVNFDPTSNPNILTTDPTTGNVSGATRPNQIGLGHELIHADHINKGTVDFTPATHSYQTATGTRTQTVATEELRTVGVPGHNTNKATENKIRQEQGLNQRGAY